MSLAPDPLEQALDAETARDHAAARARGARLYTIAQAIVAELVGVGLLPAKGIGPARVATFHTLADHLVGDHAAIDIPLGLDAEQRD